MLTFPAFPLPAGKGSEAPKTAVTSTAPSVRESEAALMLMLPPLPTAPDPTLLKILPLSSETKSLALINTLPALPCPMVLAFSVPPSNKDNEPLEIVMFPPLPVAPGSMLLKISLGNPLLTPEIVTFPVTSMLIFPAFPLPAGKVPEAALTKVCNCAPSVRESEAALMLMLPPLPTPPASTLLKIVVLLPASETEPFACTSTLPAFPCPALLAFSLPPSNKDNEPLEIVMFPPLPVAPGSMLLKISLGNPL